MLRSVNYERDVLRSIRRFEDFILAGMTKMIFQKLSCKFTFCDSLFNCLIYLIQYNCVTYTLDKTGIHGVSCAAPDFRFPHQFQLSMVS